MKIYFFFFLFPTLLQTETLNPFETNGSIFGNCGMGGGIEDKSQQDPKAVAVLAMLEDQRQELTDLRRQVVYLQVLARLFIL